MVDNQQNMRDARRNADELSSYVQDTLLSVAANISEAMSSSIQAAFDGVDASIIDTVSKDLTRSFKSAAKYSDTLANNTFKVANGMMSTRDVEKQMTELALKRSTLARKIMNARRQGADINIEDITATKLALDIQQEQLEKDKKQTELIEKRMGGLGAIFTRLSKNSFFGSLVNAEQALVAMRTEANKTGNSIKIFGAGIAAAFDGIEKSTVILAVINAAVKVFRFFKDLAFGVSEQITNIGRALGTSTETSRGLRENLYQIQRDTEGSYLNVKKLAASLIEVNQQFGYARGFSEDILKTQTLLTNRVMSTGTEASYLNMIFKATGQNTEAAFENMNKLGIEMQLVDGIGVDIKTVISDIAAAGAETASYFGFSTTALTAAVIQARKLGLNISQAKNVAGGLLDFESSIQGQLELSVLTQKQFNFGQAMAKAATGDIVGATEIVLKQMNQLTAEQRKSPIILAAMSRATGLSTEELSKQYALQYDINAQKKEYGRILAAEGSVAAKNYLIDKGIQLAEVKEITERVSAGEKFTEALEAAKEAFASIVSGGLLDRLMLVLEKVVDFLERRFGISQSANVKALTQIENTSTDKDRVTAAKALLPKMAAADKAASDLLRMQESTARIGPGAGMMSPKQIEMYDARMNEQRKLAAAVQSLADAEKKSNELLKEVAKNTGQKQDLKVDLDGSAVGSKLTRSKSKIRATSGY